MAPVRFSEHYGITRSTGDDWFDPYLTEDTKLFVDPFLIFLDKSPTWANGHARLMEFFNMVMTLLAESGFKESSPLFTKAKSLLLFPEPPEFCLGLSESSIFGAGSARGLQAGMLKGAADVIRLGIESLKHFEELALFGEQIGADRIGDITCDVLKADFIAYTQAVARRHNVALAQVNVKNSDWDASLKIWKPGLVELPLNPFASTQLGRPVGVLLTPKRFLRQMPNIDPNEFWDFAWSSEGEKLRGDFNYEIAQRVDRAQIARLARQRRRLLTAYIEKLESQPKPSYDVDEDPNLLVKRTDFAKQVSAASPITPPATQEEFVSFVGQLLANFKQCVEQRGAWRLLWVGNSPRSERHVQALFQTSAVMACRDRDVDLSPESNAGRGPVDFKVARGWHLRALLELKLAKSSSLRRNLNNQTDVYASAEGCDRAYFVIIQFRDEDCDAAFISTIETMAAQVAATKKILFEVVFVDARPKASASTV